MEKDSLCAKNIKRFVKDEILASGFFACGVAEATKLKSAEPHLHKWLSQGFNGSMDYMGRNIEKRLDPRELFPGAKSVIVAAMNYFPAIKQNSKSSFLVSKYAYGADYHAVIKKKLHLVAEKISKLVDGFDYKVFTDSAPVMEREWAVRAGLGWMGKNGCLILPKCGSFFFLGEIISNLELIPDEPFSKNFCGNCNKCIEACPTGAIVEPNILDSRKCISYLTIESKKEIPSSFRNKTNQWIFGCDVCQDVCPHNRFSTQTEHSEFSATGPVRDFVDSQWLSLDKNCFREFFKKRNSPVGRINYRKLKDNISAAFTQSKIV